MSIERFITCERCFCAECGSNTYVSIATRLARSKLFGDCNDWGLYLLDTYKVFGEVALGASADKFLSVVRGVSALFNESGRIFWGALGGRIGRIAALMVMTFGFSLVLFSYSLSPDFGGGIGYMVSPLRSLLYG